MNTAVMNQRNVVSEGVSRRSIPFLRAALIAFLVFAAYYIGSKIGHTLRFPDTSLSVIWPPSAVLFAALLLSPARLWPGLLLVTLPAHIAVHAHARIDTWMILWFYLFNCALSLLSALAVRRFVDARLNFSDLKHTITYLIVGVVACPAIVSLVSAAVKVYGKSDANIWDYWRVSYLSNALAYLTIAPAIVTGYTGGADFFRSVTRQRILEAVILAVSFLVACGLVFGGQISESIALAALLFAPLPFLLWAAIRFGPGGCSFALLTLTLISCWSEVNGHFLFNESSQSKTVLSVQMFLIAISTSVLLLAALTEERHQSAQRLRKNETQYRAIVEDQTELICRFRPDGTLTFVNSAYCNFSASIVTSWLAIIFWISFPKTIASRLENISTRSVLNNRCLGWSIR